MNNGKIQVYELDVPKCLYNSHGIPIDIGSKVDEMIRKDFRGQNLVVRCISSREHPQDDVDSLADKIIEHGTDRMITGRGGRGYELIVCDFFALRCRVNPDSIIFDNVISELKDYLPRDIPTTKVDITMLYDGNKLELVPYKGEDGKDRYDAFVFKNPMRKKEALKALIKVK